MKCDEIFAALALLEKERGIPQDFMMEKIVQALVTAYKRDHEDVENVVVDVNEEKRDLKMFVEKTVVEEVENPAAEISAEEAKAISAKYHVGDTVRFPVKNVDFGRIAAGNGKQVIIQGLREAEHGMIYDEYNSKQRSSPAPWCGWTPGPAMPPSAWAPARTPPTRCCCWASRSAARSTTRVRS